MSEFASITAERNPSRPRNERLRQQLKEKLRFELTDRHGVSSTKLVDAVIAAHADRVLQEGGSYKDSYSLLSSLISAVLSPPANHSEVEEKPPQTVQQPIEQISSPEKRPLPVKAREKIFDEWAAVARHQDELSRQAELASKAAHKERQKQYWQELEAQRREIVERESGAAKQTVLEERAQLKDELENGNNNEKSEITKDREKRAKATALVAESFADRQRTQQHVRAAEKTENVAILERYKELQEEEKRRVEDAKMSRLKVANALQGSYAAQEELRRQQKEREKAEERNVTAKWAEVESMTDKQRQRYFEHIREIQKKTEKKEELFKNYVGDRHKDQLKEDEARQIKAYAEQEAREGKKDAQLREGRIKERLCTHQALRQQIEERQAVVEASRTDDKLYAERIKQKNIELEIQDKLKQDAEKLRQQAYRQALIQQIDSTSKKRLFQGVMTEHERKVNGPELVAYTSSSAECPAVRGAKNAESGEGNSLVQRVNPMIRVNTLAQQRDSAGRYYQSGQEEPLVALARKAMQDPEMAFMRHNTQNKAYGCYRSGRRDVVAPLSSSVNYGAAGSQVIVRENDRMRLAEAGKELVRNSSSAIGKEAGRQSSVEPVARPGPMLLQPVEEYHRKSNGNNARRQLATYNIITGKGGEGKDSSGKVPPRNALYGPLRNPNPFSAMQQYQ